MIDIKKRVTLKNALASLEPRRDNDHLASVLGRVNPPPSPERFSDASGASSSESSSSTATAFFGFALPGSVLGFFAAGGLDRSHAIRRFAVFDHFPYTRHVEVAVHLERRTTP